MPDSCEIAPWPRQDAVQRSRTKEVWSKSFVKDRLTERFSLAQASRRDQVGRQPAKLVARKPLGWREVAQPSQGSTGEATASCANIFEPAHPLLAGRGRAQLVTCLNLLQRNVQIVLHLLSYLGC
jgi:hypothetical protein